MQRKSKKIRVCGKTIISGDEIIDYKIRKNMLNCSPLTLVRKLNCVHNLFKWIVFLPLRTSTEASIPPCANLTQNNPSFRSGVETGRGKNNMFWKDEDSIEITLKWANFVRYAKCSIIWFVWRAIHCTVSEQGCSQYLRRWQWDDYNRMGPRAGVVPYSFALNSVALNEVF
jgi:hypothetical protein